MKALNIFSVVLIFILLTILSQVGGIILLLWILIFRYFKTKLTKPWARRTINAFGFMVFYMIFNLLIIPFLAGLGGKARLPMSKSGNLVPVTYWTAIFMRNYIKESGKEKLLKIADEFAQKHPGLKVKYMDCNYPFYICTPTIPKGYISKKPLVTFPLTEGLIPHITHMGDKADIALVYNDENGEPSNLTPTAIGYGSSVDPFPNETPIACNTWKYSLMYRTLPNSNNGLSKDLSRELILTFRKYLSTKIFFEKHLVERFNLKGNFSNAGCNSARHDDHFHVQFK